MPRLSPEVIDQRIEVRRTRQQVLVREDPPQLAAIIDEAVLHRIVGGPAVMRAQLERSSRRPALPHVTVQVLPYSAGRAPCPGQHVRRVGLRHAPVPGVVYVEGLVGQIYLERPQDVQRYKQVFEQFAPCL